MKKIVKLRQNVNDNIKSFNCPFLEESWAMGDWDVFVASLGCERKVSADLEFLTKLE